MQFHIQYILSSGDLFYSLLIENVHMLKIYLVTSQPRRHKTLRRLCINTSLVSYVGIPLINTFLLNLIINLSRNIFIQNRIDTFLKGAFNQGAMLEPKSTGSTP